jgi:hypothetical protein
MTFLDPRYFGADQAGARLDSAMVAVYARMLLASLPSRIFEQQANIGERYRMGGCSPLAAQRKAQ